MKKIVTLHNTTPSLPVKAPTSLGTTRVMTVRGGATCGARIEIGEEGRHVANGRG